MIVTTTAERQHAPLTNGKIAAYCAVFFTVWALRELVLRAPMDQALSPVGAALVGSVIKVLVWTVPALMLVHHYPEDMDTPSLFSAPINWPRLGLMALALAAYNLMAALVTFGRIAVQPKFDPISLVGTVLFVGITEEMVFRGFLLNALLKKHMRAAAAIVITALLFVLIHFPFWISSGLPAKGLWEVARSCLTIFLLGCVFGGSFLLDKNLLTPIILHMVWNLFALLLFG